MVCNSHFIFFLLSLHVFCLKLGLYSISETDFLKVLKKRKKVVKFALS